jgi:hypothetical protein
MKILDKVKRPHQLRRIAFADVALNEVNRGVVHSVGFASYIPGLDRSQNGESRTLETYGQAAATAEKIKRRRARNPLHFPPSWHIESREMGRSQCPTS